MDDGILTAIVCIITFCVVIVFIILKKKITKKKEENDRLAYKKAKQNEYDTLKATVTNNEKLIAWAKEVAEFICYFVEKHCCNLTIDIKAFCQDLVIGEDLQDIYYPAIKHYSWNKHKPIYSWHFASENLPDLKNNQLENFSKIFGSMINSNILGYETCLAEVPRIQHDEDPTYMCRLTCYKKQVEGSW